MLGIKFIRLNEAETMNRFKRAINKASIHAAIDLEQALNEAMMSDVWPSLSGPTDIISTGELMSSGKVTANADGIKISYDTPYAMLVHYGGYVLPYGNSAAHMVYLPPRPWVDSVLNGNGPVKQFDFSKYYKEEMEKEFS